MGLLTVGTPLRWDETKKLTEHVRRHGLAQFINLFRYTKDRQDTEFRFGDEIEYQLVLFDDAERRVRLYLNAGEVLDVLQEGERQGLTDSLDSLWRPEYAAYMVEGTPGRPYSDSLKAARCVERNMLQRREEVTRILPADCAPLTLTMFPLLGCTEFSVPPARCTPYEPSSAARSLFFPDRAIFDGHPRFASLTRNVRERRGEKVSINCPIFRDTNTEWPFCEKFSDVEKNSKTQSNAPSISDNQERQDHSPEALPKATQSECDVTWTQQKHCGASRPNTVYLDAMGFGMGMCCLQVTFQARNVTSARALYDQLVPVGPLMLALTAATPIVRGYLVDTDARWYIISSSVDDRTPAERGCSGLSCTGPNADLPIAKQSSESACQRIPKSRYDSVDMYLTDAAKRYNDVPIVYNQRDYNELIAGGVDHLLAEHVAHLFVRDTISLFAERVHQDDEKETDHFENIQSTNWQSLRFKPPPSANSKIGWRVEFRTMEVQPSDMSNAAFTTFILMLVRAVKRFNLNLCMPISMVDENMRRAQLRDATRSQRFHWRCNILPSGFTLEDDTNDMQSNSENLYEMNDEDAIVDELTINEIFNGSEKFVGLIPIIEKFLRITNSNTASPESLSPRDSTQDVDGTLDHPQERSTRSLSVLSDETVSDNLTNAILQRHLRFIGDKASGKLLTFAQTIRRFVHSHPEYKHDSVVTESIAYDICKHALAIARGEIKETELTASFDFSLKRAQ